MRPLFIVGFTFLLLSCGKPDPNHIKIGTVSGVETQLFEVAKDVAYKECGVKVTIVEFNDYNLPNTALDDGSIDANAFQHLPYYQDAIKRHHYSFEIIGKTFIFPMAVYSAKFKRLQDLPQNALIAIPNDVSNQARALRLLNDAGAISLKPSAQGALNEIVKNPKKFRFKELDGAQLTRVLPDVDAAIINTTFARLVGLDVYKDGLVHEKSDSPYANLIVTKPNALRMAALQCFVRALHSPEVQNKAKILFGNSAIAAW